jgi:hypothetical protein
MNRWRTRLAELHGSAAERPTGLPTAPQNVQNVQNVQNRQNPQHEPPYEHFEQIERSGKTPPGTAEHAAVISGEAEAPRATAWETVNIAPFCDAHPARVAPLHQRDGADWWRDLYQQRIAMRQYGGLHDRAAAEQLAWGELQNRWHMRYGQRISRRRCAGCGGRICGATLDLIDGARVHLAAGNDCLIHYGKRWRGVATLALVDLGLTPPAGEPSWPATRVTARP